MVATNFDGITLYQDDDTIKISDDYNRFACRFHIEDLCVFIELIKRIKQDLVMSRNTNNYIHIFNHGFYGNNIERCRIDLYVNILTSLKLIHKDLDKYIKDKNTKELLNIITKLNIEQLGLVCNAIDKKRKEKCS